MAEKGHKNTVRRRAVTAAVVLMLTAGISAAAYGTPPLSDEDESGSARGPAARKVLYVASYHTKNPWSSAICSGIESVFESRKNLELKVVNMDTMGVRSEDIKKRAASEARRVIESWKPDIVIASDDNASKYLIVPYFMDSALPFVFCGVNWDASKYGFPSKNVTGMIEVQLVDQLVKYMSPYAAGKRVGSLRGDTMTNRIEAGHFERQLGTEIKTYFVKNISDWKKMFIRLQNETDMILLGDIDTVKLNGVSKSDVEDFIFENTEIPTGHWDAWFKKNALITLSTVPEEQGEYAAETALDILDGKSPLDIPLVKNKKADIFLNMKLAKKLGIIFPMNLVESARIVPSDE